MKRAALTLLASLAATSPLRAQGVSVQVGRLFDDGGWTAYSISWSRAIAGPLGVQLGGSWLQGSRASERLLGGALDASLFRGGRPGAYVVGGAGAGFGLGSAEPWWRSWSAGLGYELLPLPFLSLGFEARYREMMPARRSGAELAFRLGTSFGAARPPVRVAGADSGAPSGSTPVARPRVEPETAQLSARDTAATEPVPSDSAPIGAATPMRLATAATFRGRAIVRDDADQLVRDIIRIAEGEIGRRYQLGGRGEAGDGFDCSGLIQYAYAQLGITLPRRSVEQATQGLRIEKRETQLRAGDILTFSSGGGRVTHVGLYMGDGRFIHSASRGVQVSRLSQDDPYGRWWYRRWVGVRRIVAESAA